MKVLVHTRTREEGAEGRFGMKYAESLDHLLSEANVVSLHVPLTKETEDMVDLPFLQKMKPEAILVNTAHENLVKENDLWHCFDLNKQLWYACD